MRQSRTSVSLTSTRKTDPYCDMTDVLSEKITNGRFSEVTLIEVLDAREMRVRVQREMLEKNSCPLICFTMNIAGPIKTSLLIERAFRHGLDSLDEGLKNSEVIEKRIEYGKCGPIAFFSVKDDADCVKKICTEIEESTALGRLLDIDVIDIGGKKLERSVERCCIVCGKKGRACAAGRLHSVEELQKKTFDIMYGHFKENDPIIIAELARKSLIDEVETTPKPGLVDSENNGSHRDMTPDTFRRSADALVPYFIQCVKIGMDSKDTPPELCFKKLRAAGIEAEKAMFEATSGVNTHKGVIYSMGVLLGAVGRLWTPQRAVADLQKIFDECAALTAESTKEDFAKTDKTTAGGRLYLLNGERGIRGEVTDGFPSVKNIALPVYKKCIEEGKTKNDAGVMTLLHLIANIYDTSVFNRGGEEGVAYARAKANETLSEIYSATPSNKNAVASAKKLDELFISKNLSPGGAADLLAITYLIASLEGKNICQS